MVDLPNLFPAQRPTARKYNFGRFPVTVQPVFGQPDVQFLHGIEYSQISLELVYQNLTLSEMASIRTHYRSMKSGYRSFQLPSTVWAGHSSAYSIVPTSGRWKYASQPEETHKLNNLVDTVVNLISVI